MMWNTTIGGGVRFMNALEMAVSIIFHPIITFQNIKRLRNRFHYYPIFIILLFVVGVRCFSIYYTHYPLSGIQPREMNLFLEAVKLILPIATWALASYSMTTILEGESQLRETLLATSYCMIPYIIITIVLTLFSQLLEVGQESFYYSIQAIMWIWIIGLLFFSLKEMNEYSMPKTIVIALLSVFTMAIVWATMVLFFAISAQFFSFIKEIFVEFRFKFY